MIVMVAAAVCVGMYACCVMAGEDDERSGWK